MARWIGYMAIVLLLTIIKAAIDDHCRDRVLAYMLCAALILVLVVLVIGAAW